MKVRRGRLWTLRRGRGPFTQRGLRRSFLREAFFLVLLSRSRAGLTICTLQPMHARTDRRTRKKMQACNNARPRARSDAPPPASPVPCPRTLQMSHVRPSLASKVTTSVAAARGLLNRGSWCSPPFGNRLPRDSPHGTPTCTRCSLPTPGCTYTWRVCTFE